MPDIPCNGKYLFFLHLQECSQGVRTVVLIIEIVVAGQMEYLPALAKHAERQEMLGGLGLIDFDIPEKRSDLLAAGQGDFDPCQSTRERLHGQLLDGLDSGLAGLVAIGKLPDWVRSEIFAGEFRDVFHLPANAKGETRAARERRFSSSENAPSSGSPMVEIAGAVSALSLMAGSALVS